MLARLVLMDHLGALDLRDNQVDRDLEEIQVLLDPKVTKDSLELLDLLVCNVSYNCSGKGNVIFFGA